MIRKNPAHDVTTPPGQLRYQDNNPMQVKYLRDVIKKYYEDEASFEAARRPPKALEPLEAGVACDNAEKRLQGRIRALEEHNRKLQAKIMEKRTYPANAQDKLERLKQALLKLCDDTKGGRDWSAGDGQVWAYEIRKILQENT